MTAVKGSKQYHMKVVPYRPVLRVLVWSLGTFLVLLAIAGSFFLGSYKAARGQEQAVAERDRLRHELAAKTEEMEALRQEVVNLQLGSEVDRKASEGVRNEVIELKAQIAGLQEDISFYRGLMAPTGNKQGLAIGSLNVISTGVPRHYEYKLVVQQLATTANTHEILTGYLNFNIVGRQGNVVKVIPLKDVSAQVGEENIRLRFKYFQSIEGELILPQEFEPERIELMAKSTGRDAATVEKKFGWLVQES